MRQPGEQSLAIMVHGGCATVHGLTAHDLGTECEADRLVAKADAENRPFARPRLDHRNRHAGIFWSSRTRRNHDGTVRMRGSDRDAIAAHYVHTGAKHLQSLGQVPDERIFVVEQQDQIGLLRQYRSATR